MKKAQVYMHDALAGTLQENDAGYVFLYDSEYLKGDKCVPVSLTLPLAETPFQSTVLFPFFDGLIPEGWLLELAAKNWKLNVRDRMGLLLATCADCIGAVSIIPE
jgi:serine/threonine-protein kinase HipA